MRLQPITPVPSLRRVLAALAVISVTVLFHGPCYSQPLPFSVRTSGELVVFSWQPVAGARNYLFYYTLADSQGRPSREHVQYIDLIPHVTGFSVPPPCETPFWVELVARTHYNTEVSSEPRFFQTECASQHTAMVSLAWDPSPDASGYLVHYAPYPNVDYVETADVGDMTQTTLQLLSGGIFYAAVQAYDGDTMSSLSNLVLFVVP